MCWNGQAVTERVCFRHATLRPFIHCDACRCGPTLFRDMRSSLFVPCTAPRCVCYFASLALVRLSASPLATKRTLPEVAEHASAWRFLSSRQCHRARHFPLDALFCVFVVPVFVLAKPKVVLFRFVLRFYVKFVIQHDHECLARFSPLCP